jgi:hypothetical protein
MWGTCKMFSYRRIYAGCHGGISDIRPMHMHHSALNYFRPTRPEQSAG